MRNKFLAAFAMIGAIGFMSACDDETTDPQVDPECTAATVATDCEANENCIAGQCVTNTDECTTAGAPTDCAGFACDSGTCLDTCLGDIDCASGFACNTTLASCEAQQDISYTQVLVISDTTKASVDSGKPNPGPDIDAVSMTLGSDFFASTVVGKTGAFDGNPDNVTTDGIPQAAIGEPNAINTTGDDCANSFADDDSLIFSLGAGPLGTEDGATGIGFALLSNFQNNTGADAPAFSIDSTSTDCLTVFELNKMEGTPVICPNLTKVDEDYAIYLVDSSVEQADITNGDGYIDAAKVGALVVDGLIVSFGSASGVAQVCAGDEQ